MGGGKIRSEVTQLSANEGGQKGSFPDSHVIDRHLRLFRMSLIGLMRTTLYSSTTVSYTNRSEFENGNIKKKRKN